MTWFKRNLFVILVIALAACAIITLAVDGFTGLGREPAATGQISGDTVTGAGFQNRADEADEVVDAWIGQQQLCQYDLDIKLDPDEKQLSGTMEFLYVNTEDQPMSELHFLLYANSHEKAEYGLFAQEDFASAYPNGFSPGSTAIQSVESSDGKTDFLVNGSQNQILQVRLPSPVAAGETTKLTITYTVTIPNCYGRFGYGENTISLVNCHPILSVYDSNKWYDYPYYDIGDPFYSETADYDATITAPAGYTIASTGVVTMIEQGSDRLWTVDAPGRRDFGFVASDSFEVMSAEIDGVLVRSYYVEGNKSTGRKALDTAVDSIRLYNESFGKYPFAEFAVVEADFFIGGMEYPGMVMIDHELYESSYNEFYLELVVAHETGHQWWYSVIGDNEVLEPWLDEGLTEFTTQYFFEKERDSSYTDAYDQQIEYYADSRIEQEGNFAVTLPVFSFDSGMTYSAWVYDRTAAILYELREEIGDEQFFAALKQYYGDNLLGVTSRSDLEKAFEDATGRELTQWFEQRFNTSGN